MDDSIQRVLKAGLVSPNEAYMKANDKSRFESLLAGGRRGAPGPGVLLRHDREADQSRVVGTHAGHQLGVRGDVEQLLVDVD